MSCASVGAHSARAAATSRPRHELLALLRPSIDGLILESETGRATFLPAVWEQIPDPAQFVRQLKMKAGWPADVLVRRVRCSRYTTESFGEESSRLKP